MRVIGAQYLAPYFKNVYDALKRLGMPALAHCHEAPGGQGVSQVHRVLTLLGEPDHFGGQLCHAHVICLREGQRRRGPQRLRPKRRRGVLSDGQRRDACKVWEATG
jgi:hypothetical protein